jgi:dihydrolipoamide dehydrogenase
VLKTKPGKKLDVTDENNKVTEAGADIIATGARSVNYP